MGVNAGRIGNSEAKKREARDDFLSPNKYGTVWLSYLTKKQISFMTEQRTQNVLQHNNYGT